MNLNQIELIYKIVRPHLEVLRKVYSEKFNNKWNNEFGILIEETKKDINYDIENDLLNPTETITPNLTRTFRKEDALIRIEISNILNTIFTKFESTYHHNSNISLKENIIKCYGSN